MNKKTLSLWKNVFDLYKSRNFICKEGNIKPKTTFFIMPVIHITKLDVITTFGLMSLRFEFVGTGKGYYRQKSPYKKISR